MQYRRLGRSGLQVSELSLGSWVTYHNQVDVAAAREMLAMAMDAGVNFFDNAEAYAVGKSETVMGDAIKARIALRDYGTKDDIADACIWLASDAARYVTGAIINIDGGSEYDASGDALAPPQRS